MKKIFTVLLLIHTIICLNSCKKFSDINTNPNATGQVTSAMLATSMILNITRSDISTTYSFVMPSVFAKYLTWNQGQVDLQYNRLGRTDFARLATLRNIKPMVEYATSPELVNSYQALGHFIRAWQFFQTTMQVGDIPYSDAVKGETENIIKPKYDTQKEVFLGILNELDQANTLFGKGANFAGDPIFNGNIEKWRRVVNSFELHVLINLYKKTADPDLKVVERFKEIVASRLLMRDFNDNFALTYTSAAGQNYPYSDVPAGSGNSFVKSNYSMLAKTLIEPLKTLQDKRLFYYAAPSPVKIAGGLNQNDYNAYVGSEPSNSFASLGTMRNTKDYSDFNLRYIQLVDAEPVSVFSYWDLQFILAEATVRGWIGSTAAQNYYANGISSSMKFIAQYTPDLAEYHHNMKMDATYIASYPSSPAAVLTGTSEEQIAKIITQKYLANFLQGIKYGSWYENRRTGYPKFILNPTTNLNTPNTVFPLRWLYPSTELNYNSDNVATAIARQFGGIDDTNQLMWLLKN